MNPQKNRKRKTDKGRSGHRNKAVALLVLFCLCIGGISAVSAKYMKQTEYKNNAATAKEFYFESDLLDGSDTVHTVVPTQADENGKNTASVTIRLKNYVDDLRFSETAIEYTVSVKEEETASEASEVQITYPTSDADQNGKHVIASGAKNNADVLLANLQPGKTYLVTATTDNTYQKTLTGKIKVAEPDYQIYASLNDEKQYIEVTVWTTDYHGPVKLNYGDIGLLPDNTDAKLADAQTTGGTITESNWKENASHVFRFFKSDVNKNYKVTVNGQEVTVSEAK